MSSRSEYFIGLSKEIIGYSHFDTVATIIAMTVFLVVLVGVLLKSNTECNSASKMPLDDSK